MLRESKPMEFLLDPDVTFLNHGSFGACPREVHEEYQRLQRELETQPVRFLQRRLPDLLHEARNALADYIGAENDEVVFVQNPTFAVNTIAKSLELKADDELLTSNHEYGACMNAWRFMQEAAGFKIVHQTIELPVTSHEQIVEQFWAGVTDRTRLISLSQITSPTALTLPVKEICRRAKERGILTIIDGAHVPGQLDLNVKDVGADFYTGACHKWLCSAKGASFLYASREKQPLVKPLVVGWGWGDVQRQFDSGSEFQDNHQWLGTHDPAAYLTVPKAIQFQRDHDWPTVQKRCRTLAEQAVELLSKLPNIERVHPNEFFLQMGLVEIPASTEPKRLKQQLLDEYNIEVPVIAWQDHMFVRISIQAYNTEANVERLVEAFRNLL